VNSLREEKGDLFGRLFRDLEASLWRAVYVYSGGRREIADDAVSEAFARALENRVPIRSPKSWLYKTAFRIAAAEMRRDSREVAISDSLVGINEEVYEVMEALRALSPAQRSSVFLRYVVDMRPREIAKAIGSTEVAVRVHLHRGRQRLRDLLGEEDVE
jgi:RNA polymerase sigma factor (sigma-70 family)